MEDRKAGSLALSVLPDPSFTEIQLQPPHASYTAQPPLPRGYHQAPLPQGYHQAPPYNQAELQQGHMTQATPQSVHVVQVQQGAPIQTSASQVPIVVVCSGDLGDGPTMTTCRNCGQRIETRVVYRSGAFAWLMCGVCILLGLVLGCCLIPFFVDSFKDAHHFCTNCNANLCIHKRM